jgi:MEMO1 family protein
MPCPFSCSLLMCHAPVVIPEVGGDRGARAAATTAAMAQAAGVLVAGHPEVVILVSPHAPRRKGSWGIAEGPSVSGDFTSFGAPDCGVLLPLARPAAALIARAAAARGLRSHGFPGDALDHGALVPLRFLAAAGWRGPTLVIAFPIRPELDDARRLGAALADAALASGRRWALVASGDMSHRLTPGAPAGYDPRATDFDLAVHAAIEAGDLEAALSVDDELRDLAAEDVLDPLAVAAAAIGDTGGRRVLSYQAPFGVGYLIAVLCEQAEAAAATPPAPAGETGPRALLRVARAAIAAHLERTPYRPPEIALGDIPTGGVFVTLFAPGRELRGCIGHIGPEENVIVEVAECAVASATGDVRFAPVTRAELDTLTVEVSLLGALESASVADLDPLRWGIVVSQGRRRGVLLPAIDGVDSVEDQLAVACRKGHVDRSAPFQIERFSVLKVAE